MISRFLLCMMLAASVYTVSGSNAFGAFDAERYKELKTADEKGVLQNAGKEELASLEKEKAKADEEAKEAEVKAKAKAEEDAEKNKFIAANIRTKARDAAKEIEARRAEVIGAMMPNNSDFSYSSQEATENCLLRSLMRDPNMKECDKYVTDEDIANFKKKVQ